MENKYFTPAIEDIRIGLICEVKPINESYDWKPAVLHYNSGYEDKGHPNSLYNLKPFWWTYREGEGEHSYPTMIQLQSLNHIRIPYLTKEQIEAEGWVYIPEYEATLLWGAMRYKKDNLIIVHDFNKHTISIHIYKEDEYIRSKVLDIECKDINTFRYICKLLK